ncbi:branched-chain amino acid ABC transporter permease/ATP-binding protein [Nocardia sp. NPDC005366]|uniref:branched-chain amino acid ABC transporter permease/ATP-binding protein n=1 Tax=Nocardia sp. NPDC005366 TaxID=3156878 RepID=UPI0033BDBC4D
MSSFLEYAVLSLGAAGVYAWVALGVVVVHRGSGVLNFAQGAMLMLSAYVFNDLRESWGAWPAAVFAVLLTGALSLATHVFVMRPLRNAAPLTRTVATLGVLIVLQSLVVLIYGTESKPTLPVLSDGQVNVLGTDVGINRLLVLAGAVLVAAGLWAFFRWTTAGLAVSAAAENPRAMATLGWSPNVIAGSGWFGGGVIAGVAGIIIAPQQGPLSATNLILLIVPGLAVAVVGSFRSFPLVIVGAVGLALLELEAKVQLADRYDWLQGVEKAMPLAVVVAVLTLRGSAIPGRGHEAEGRPELGTGRVNPWLLVGGIGILGVLMLTIFSENWTNALTANLAWAIIMLSVVVLVGYTGQLSLGQLAFSGVAALVAGRLVATTDVPFWLAVLLGVLATVPVGVLFALPALRTRGLDLAVVTLSLAVAVEQIAFKRAYTSPSPDGVEVGGFLAEFSKTREGTVVQGEVRLFGFSLDRIDHPTSYAFFALGCFVICALLVANLRRSRAGRRLIAVRTNERAASSLGISVVGAKIYAFALSAAIAGLGGIVLSFQQRTLGFGSGEFDAFKSILVVAFAVVGGVGYVSGSLFGAQLMPAALGAAISRFVSERLITLGSGVKAVAVAASVLVGLLVGRSVHRNLPKRTGAWKFLPLAVAVAIGVLGLLQADRVAGWLRELDLYVPLIGGVLLIVLIIKNAGGIASDIAHATARLPLRARRPADVLAPAGDEAKVRPESLNVSGLTVRFGAVTAVDDVSFEVPPGQIVGLIGPNGAGKTTVVDALTGYAKAASGQVSLSSRSLDGLSAHQRARAGLSRSFQSLELFDDLTVLENIAAASDSRDGLGYLTSLLRPGRLKLSGAAAAAVREFRLEDDLHTRVSSLPYGRRRLVAIARAIAARPSVLLLDEPAAGLDETESRELAALVRRLCDEWGLAVLLIEHDMAFVMGVCDRVVVLDHGQRIADGTPEETQRNAAVLAAYLGGEAEAEELASTASTTSTTPGLVSVSEVIS